MDFRQYTSSDLAPFSALVTRYFREDLGAPFSEEQVHSSAVAQFVELNGKGVAPIVLATDSEEALGFVIFQIDSPGSDWNDRPGWGFIRELYVVPEARGRGVGEALLNVAEQVLAQSDATQAYALATPASLGFWEKEGWAVDPEAVQDPSGAVVVTGALPAKAAPPQV